MAYSLRKHYNNNARYFPVYSEVVKLPRAERVKPKTAGQSEGTLIGQARTQGGFGGVGRTPPLEVELCACADTRTRAMRYND